MVTDQDELILQVTEFRSTETDVYTSERPMTLSRPDTSTTMRYDSSIILCISEGRSIQSEIGTASLNLKTSECILSQYTDSSSFPYTFHKLAVLQPGVILMASTCIDPPSKAYQVLEPTMEKRSDVISVPRNYFNYSMGLESVQHFQLKEGGAEEEFISRISDKYYALAALSALFKYVHEMHNILFESHSVRFKYTNIEGTMFVDASTSAQLELIFNSKDPLSKYSLLGILDKTKTAMGTRLIRASILQPLVEQSEIQNRLDVVEELLSNPSDLTTLRTKLNDFLDLEHLISSFIQTPQKEAIKFAENGIHRILQLKQILKQTQTAAQVLPDSNSCMFIEIKKALATPVIPILLELIHEVIDEQVNYQKGALALRHQKCFAVRAGFHGLLDVARKTFDEVTNDVHDLIKEYSAAMNFPIKLVYTSSVGYSMSLSLDQLGEEPMHDEFINATRKKNLIFFTSMRLASYNERLKESQHEIYTLSEKFIGDLMISIHEYLPVLYKISEAVAMLDMLLCFALVAHEEDYVKPEISDTLALRNSRHPILEKVSSTPVVPNDCYVDDSVRFQIVTGPNMSGKSIYLNQIAIILVMAQLGCYVPCDYASIKVSLEMIK